MSRNIIITGGAGFIGGNLARHHTSIGDTVTIIDNFQTSHKTDKLPGTVIEQDLTSFKIPDKLLRDADLVYHMASSVGVKFVDLYPDHVIQSMMKMNLNLLPQFEKHKCRVIFASTSEVYGNNSDAKENDNLQIGNPEKLRWGYACGKLMTEFLLKTYTFPSTVARFFNITGPGQLSTHGMVLPTFIEKAKSNQDIIVHGSGKQTRSFCDIRDAINMLDIISSADHIGETYNIGNSDNLVTILDLARQVVDVTESSSNIIREDYTSHFSDQFCDIFSRNPNISKISKYYKPKYNINDIITNMQ